MSTKTDDTDNEHSATNDDESNDGEADDVTEITIRRDSRGWTVVETTEDVICEVSYVITRGSRQRVTLKTEIGRPESDSEDGDE